MNKGRIQLNRWHFKFGLTPAWWMNHGLMFQFGIFKMTSRPPEGEVVQRSNYSGFWIRWEIRDGFEISL